MDDLTTLIMLCSTTGLGIALGIMYVSSTTPQTFKVFLAKFQKKKYKYGLGLPIDGAGKGQFVRLMKHDKKDDYYIDPKTKRPYILDRKNVELGLKNITIDNVPISIVSSLDQIEATPLELRAATQLVYDMARSREQEVGTDGAPTGHTRPRYPLLAQIPIKENNKIADMLYSTDDDELSALSLNYTVIEKNYMVPKYKVNEKGEQTDEVEKDRDGNTIFVKPNKEQIQAIKEAKADMMANEVRQLREEACETPVTAGVVVYDALYSMVVRPWLDDQVDVIDTQNEQSKEDQRIEQKRQDKRTDNNLMMMLGAAIALVIIGAGLKYAGVL